MIDRVRMNELRDMVHTLCNFGILECPNADSVRHSKGKKESLVQLKVDLEDLVAALENF